MLSAKICKDIDNTFCELQLLRKNINKYIEKYFTTIENYSSKQQTIINQYTFSNNDGITFRSHGIDPKPSYFEGNAIPFPSEININNLSGKITNLTITLQGVNISFLENIYILLEAPDSKKTNVLLMSADCGNNPGNNINITFSNTATTSITNSSIPVLSGEYKPTLNTVFAFNGNYTYGNSLSVFNNLSPNGKWRLWCFGVSVGNTGNITGWTLNMTTETNIYI